MIGGRAEVPSEVAKSALEALLEALEVYMIDLLEDANLLAIHARWITLQPRDIQQAQKMGGINWDKYVSLQVSVQNQRRKWHFPLNFRNGII